MALNESTKAAQEIYFKNMQNKSGSIKLSPEQQEASTRLGLPRIALMLFGMAFESLLKGILISRRPELVSEKGVDEQISRGDHSLVEYFQAADISFTQSEKFLLERLSDSVRWAGRYPIPKKETLHRFKKHPDKGIIFPGTPLLEDEVQINQLWVKVSEIVRTDPAMPKYERI